MARIPGREALPSRSDRVPPCIRSPDKRFSRFSNGFIFMVKLVAGGGRVALSIDACEMLLVGGLRVSPDRGLSFNGKRNRLEIHHGCLLVGETHAPQSGDGVPLG